MLEEQRLTRNGERLLIFAVMLGSFLAVINTTTINIALPSFREYYHTDIKTVQWLVVGYMLANGLVMPTIGYFMDRFSGCRLFALGLVLMLATSLVCGVAPNIEILIAARIGQGLAGGILMPVPGALVYQFIPRERQLMTISVISMVTSVGIALGPTLAGVLINYWGWRAIFFFNVPVALLDLFLVIKYVPVKILSAEQRLDVIGLACASIGTVGLLIGFNQGSELGWTSPLVLGTLIVSAAALGYFIWHEVRIHQPMLNFAVFGYAGFTYSFLLNGSTSIATCLSPMFMALFLQDVLQLNAMHAGLAMFFPSLVMALMAPVAAKSAERFSRRAVTFVGMMVLVGATWELSRFSLETTILAFTLWLSLRYVGLGLMIPIVNNFAMSAVPMELASHASAMLNWTRQLISTISISVFSILYGSHMLKYAVEGMGAENLATQDRLIECMSINDVNFYSLILLVVCVPLIYFLKDKLLAQEAAPGGSVKL